MISRFTLIQLTLLAAVAAAGCSCRRIDNVAYSEFAAFGTDGWDPVYTLDFTPWPADSLVNPSDRFDLILTLRYSPRNASTQIPLEITEEDENGVMDTHRLTINIRNDKGKFRGTKSVFLYEISDTIRRDFKIPDGYSVSINSLSPVSNTLGLRNVGLTLTTN